MTSQLCRKTSLALLAIAVAVVGVSCGGGLEGDSPTGVSALPDFVEESAAAVGEVSSSGKNKVLICHKGKDKKVPDSAVAGHLRHGDTVGGCSSEPDPNTCPCFTAEQVATTAACPDAVTQCVRLGAGYLCRIVCSGTASDFFLDASGCEGPGDISSPVDDAQFNACFGILLADCPSFGPSL